MPNYSNWILESSDKIQLHIEYLQWIKQFTGVTEDIHVSVTLDKKKYFGRGHSDNKDTAIKIAISEAIERGVGLKFFDSTNGIASHPSLEIAKINALYELIERDLFLSHILTNTPLRYSEVLTKSVPKQISMYIKINGDEIGIYEMAENSIGKGLVCLISGRNVWGGIFGFSFNQSGNMSLVNKATLEAFRLYWHRRNKDSLRLDITIEQFNRLESWTFVDHGRLALNLEYFNKINHLFPTKCRGEMKGPVVEFPIDEFSFSVLSNEFCELVDCPLKVVRCDSPNVQKLSVGPYNVNNVSFFGLSRFVGNDKFEINEIPHPVN